MKPTDEITIEFLVKEDACCGGTEWFKKQEDKSLGAIINSLLKSERLHWANWLLCHVFNRRKRLQYAIFAAEQALPIFEKDYPEDNRPRKAIEAAKAVLENDTEETRNAAWEAADDARDATCWANGAASKAAEAASKAAGDASDASLAAWAAGAASDASWAASKAAEAAGDAMFLKIIRYGCGLIGIKIKGEQNAKD